ncbi:hypothetical protein C1646_142423 [Rhizophagus diaphanus]|nr:hypothetical protein C1646_142423 [Rhizophagus diaphanus] [Rhizophagus sp. MUCL 43196]
MAFQLYGLQVQIDLIVKKKSPIVAPVNKMVWEEGENQRERNRKAQLKKDLMLAGRTTPIKSYGPSRVPRRIKEQCLLKQVKKYQQSIQKLKLVLKTSGDEDVTRTPPGPVSSLSNRLSKSKRQERSSSREIAKIKSPRKKNSPKPTTVNNNKISLTPGVGLMRSFI